MAPDDKGTGFVVGDLVRLRADPTRAGRVTAVGNFVHVNFEREPDDPPSSLGRLVTSCVPGALEHATAPSEEGRRGSPRAHEWDDGDPAMCFVCKQTANADPACPGPLAYAPLALGQEVHVAMEARAVQERWGVGARAQAEPFDTVLVGKKKVELLFGEHPHHRRDNTIYARFPDGEIVPFDGHRVEIEVRLKTSNYLKQSRLSGNEIRKSCRAELLMNGLPVYAVSGRDPERVLYKLPPLLERLGEFPVAFWDKEERAALIGRPVYYDQTPCRIERVLWDDGDVVLAAEPGHLFPSLLDDEAPAARIKADLLSDHIRWFRDVEPDPSSS